MPVSYKKLWILLIERGITKVQFRELAKISTATLNIYNITTTKHCLLTNSVEGTKQ